jgi:hypothetical protein
LIVKKQPIQPERNAALPAFLFFKQQHFGKDARGNYANFVSLKKKRHFK